MDSPVENNSKNILVILLLLIVLFIGILLIILAYSLKASSTTDSIQTNISKITDSTTKIVSDPYPTTTLVLDTNTSQQFNVVVNKKRRLADNYVPPSLVYVDGYPVRSEIVEDLKSLLDDSKRNNTPIRIISGYRSYDYQKNLYNNYVSIYGQQEADTFSARPGHSEHQTGLAVDVSNDECLLKSCFGETPAGKWLANNAQNYGFIIRYPLGKEKITGYVYEPWHLRYVGLFEARFIDASNLTLDEMFDVPAGDYLP